MTSAAALVAEVPNEVIGYAVEASRGLPGYLAERLPDHPILAVVQTSNGRSLRTGRRLGFRPRASS